MDSRSAPTASAGYSSSTERFALSGPSAKLDPRFDAYRPDLADVALASRIFAPHYAAPVVRPLAEETALYERPGEGETDILAPGEAFAVLDVAGGWAWGFRQSDHRVGYVRASSLAAA